MSFDDVNCMRDITVLFVAGDVTIFIMVMIIIIIIVSLIIITPYWGSYLIDLA